MLTTSSLYDLVKARSPKPKKQATKTGPRGGRYYETPSGEKIYVEPAVPVKRVPMKEIKSAPAEQKKTRKTVAVQQVAAAKQKPKRSERMGQTVGKKEPISGKRAWMRGKYNWKAYTCVVCGAHVIPKRQEKRVPIQYPHETDDAYEERVLDHHVWGGGELPHETYIDEKVVMIPSHGPHKGELIHLRPGDIQPEMVADRVCPKDYGQHIKLIRKKPDVKASRQKVKSTKASRAEAKRRKKQEKEHKKKLSTAKKVPHGKRTPEQRAIVERHEAQEAVAKRAAEEKAKVEERQAKRRGQEETWKENQEAASLERVRHSYRRYLIQTEGMDQHDASTKAAKATAKQLRDHQYKMNQEAAKHRAEVHRHSAKEGAQKRVAPAVSAAELDHHYGRRRAEPTDHTKDEHALYIETHQHPQERMDNREARTRKLEERKAKKKKVKKSVRHFIVL